MSELSSHDFDGLRRAVARVFTARATHESPASLPTPPDAWARPYRALAEEVGLDPDPSVGHALAAAFLDPVLADEQNLGHWDANATEWQPRT